MKLGSRSLQNIYPNGGDRCITRGTQCNMSSTVNGTHLYGELPGLTSPELYWASGSDKQQTLSGRHYTWAE